jgi:hypothetical protein
MEILGHVDQWQTLNEEAQEKGSDQGVKEEAVKSLDRRLIEDLPEDRGKGEPKDQQHAEHIEEKEAHQQVHRELLFEHGIPQCFLPLLTQKTDIKTGSLHPHSLSKLVDPNGAAVPQPPPPFLVVSSKFATFGNPRRPF